MGAIVLIDPRNTPHEVRNIQAFVEECWELFDSDEDIRHRQAPEHVTGGRRQGGYWTRADRGLRAVAEGRINSWKGWTRRCS